MKNFALSVITLIPNFRFMCRRVMAALGRAYFFCMGFRVVVKGTQVNSSEAPILAVAPHSTFFDGIVCIVAGLPSTVSRVENLATPIFGREMLCVSVHESDRSVLDHRHTAQDFLSECVCLCVCVCCFTQGSCAVFSQCWCPGRTQTPGRTRSRRLRAGRSQRATGLRSAATFWFFFDSACNTLVRPYKPCTLRLLYINLSIGSDQYDIILLTY